MGALFFSKNHAQKTQIKNKKKCRFAIKNLKFAQNHELSERASFASQPSKPSNSRKPRKAIKPTKNGKSLFF